MDGGFLILVCCVRLPLVDGTGLFLWCGGPLYLSSGLWMGQVYYGGLQFCRLLCSSSNSGWDGHVCDVDVLCVRLPDVDGTGMIVFLPVVEGKQI